MGMGYQYPMEIYPLPSLVKPCVFRPPITLGSRIKVQGAESSSSTSSISSSSYSKNSWMGFKGLHGISGG